MPRFFISSPLPPGRERLTLAGDDQHHLEKVLRLRPGDELTVCDSQRTDYLCRIESIDAAKVSLCVLSRKPNQAEPSFRATLYQGLSRKDRMDLVVQKAVELGVYEIVPVECERSVVRLSAAGRQKKKQRWQQISEAAAKQSGRGILPAVREPKSLSQLMPELSGHDLTLFFWENERERSLKSHLQERAPKLPENPRIAVIIGPEGGFSAAEANALILQGLQPLSLGRRILRTETAGPAVLAMLTYQFDDF